MKKIYIAVLLLSSLSAFAGELDPDLGIDLAGNSPFASSERPNMGSLADPSGIILGNASAYAASDSVPASSNKYIHGRNQNVVAGRSKTVERNKKNSLSRNVVSQRNISLSAQVENLESTMGEIVQKFEDDRMKVSKEHQELFEKNRKLLSDTYKIISKFINVDNLGQEQDPHVANAFKCEKYAETNKAECITDSSKDPHDIDKLGECKPNQRLHWTGKNWECIGIFQTSGFNVKCNDNDKKRYGQLTYDSDKYNGKICSDYIFNWEFSSWSKTCKDGLMTRTAKCYRRSVAGGAKKEIPFKDAIGVCPGKLLLELPCSSKS